MSPILLCETAPEHHAARMLWVNGLFRVQAQILNWFEIWLDHSRILTLLFSALALCLEPLSCWKTSIPPSHRCRWLLWVFLPGFPWILLHLFVLRAFWDLLERSILTGGAATTMPHCGDGVFLQISVFGWCQTVFYLKATEFWSHLTVTPSSSCLPSLPCALWQTLNRLFQQWLSSCHSLLQSPSQMLVTASG